MQNQANLQHLCLTLLRSCLILMHIAFSPVRYPFITFLLHSLFLLSYIPNLSSILHLYYNVLLLQTLRNKDVMHCAIFNSCCNICDYWQYLFPWHGRKYAKSEKTLRAVGRNCIEERIKALENKEDVPQDILMRMLRLLRK